MKKALLIVASPFQLINVKAALEHFKIKEYKLYILKDNNSDRHIQITNMADYYQMEYALINYVSDIYKSKNNFIRNFIKSFLGKNDGIYDIIIHGDYRNVYPLISFYSLLKKRGKICFVDDGNATINIFKGKDINWKVKILYQVLKLSMRIKRIPTFIYFTIYDDIKTKLFNIIPNNLSIINSSKISDNIIYIIATNTLLYTEYLGIRIQKFRDRFISLIELLRANNPDNKIIYIPHGRDKYTEIYTLCKKYDIEYKKLDVCVESYFATEKTYPKMIYGFTSSALYNIKKMYPHSECYNLSIRGNIQEHQTIYDNINSYYEKHGILLKELTNV